MPAELNGTYLLIGIALLAILSWRSLTKRVQQANAAMAQGHFSAALQLCTQILNSSSPAAWLMRRLHPGQLELQIAFCLANQGHWSEALEWCQRGLAHGRAPQTKIGLHQIAAHASTQIGDNSNAALHYSALQQLTASDQSYAATSGPLPPVTSKLTMWIWPLAVLAMVPLLGTAAGLVLLIVSAGVLRKKTSLPHDRKAAKYGFSIALLSLIFGAVVLGQATATKLRSPAPDETSQTTSADLQQEQFLMELDSQETPLNHATTNPADATRNQVRAVLKSVKEDFNQDQSPNPQDEIADIDNPESGSLSPDSDRLLSLIIWAIRGGSLLILIISIMLHEIGHAVAAYWAGDPTARDQRRFSLNPIRHLDLLGSVIVPGVLILSGSPSVIGWAKPVPVRPQRFRHLRLGNLGVSLAGVSMNIGLAMLAANLLIVIMIMLSWMYPGFALEGQLSEFADWALTDIPHYAFWKVTMFFLIGFVLINSVLAGFNLIPFPPLDGFGVLRSLLPANLAEKANRITGMGMILLIILIATDAIDYLLLPGLLFTKTLLAVSQWAAFDM